MELSDRLLYCESEIEVLRDTIWRLTSRVLSLENYINKLNKHHHESSALTAPATPSTAYDSRRSTSWVRHGSDYPPGHHRHTRPIPPPPPPPPNQQADTDENWTNQAELVNPITTTVRSEPVKTSSCEGNSGRDGAGADVDGATEPSSTKMKTEQVLDDPSDVAEVSVDAGKLTPERHHYTPPPTSSLTRDMQLEVITTTSNSSTSGSSNNNNSSTSSSSNNNNSSTSSSSNNNNSNRTSSSRSSSSSFSSPKSPSLSYSYSKLRSCTATSFNEQYDLTHHLQQHRLSRNKMCRCGDATCTAENCPHPPLTLSAISPPPPPPPLLQLPSLQLHSPSSSTSSMPQQQPASVSPTTSLQQQLVTGIIKMPHLHHHHHHRSRVNIISGNSSSSSLSSQQDPPKRHACLHCNKKFKRAQELTVHTRIHTGEKPYSCPVCFKTFSQSSSVTLHLPVHTGWKPYKCTVCSKPFARLSHMKKHVQNVHTSKSTPVGDVGARSQSQ